METSWIILLICLSIPALLALATIWIQIQNRRISAWKETTGQIVSSKPVAREVRSKQTRTSGSQGNTDFVTDETIETRNFAEIAYSFAVGASVPCALSRPPPRRKLVGSMLIRAPAM